MILLIDKPSGITSNDVVQKIKKHFKYKKVGHGGTLDPMASGLMIIGCNESTKLLNNQLNSVKEYIFEVKFGFMTDTYDLEGKILQTSERQVKPEEIKEAVEKFPLSYEQQVPIYSAVKISGKKLYEYARKEQEVDLPSRFVTIHEIQIEDLAINYCRIKIKVSKGFYIRSFAVDLAKSINAIAMVTSIRRTMSGDYHLSKATKLSELLV